MEIIKEKKKIIFKYKTNITIGSHKRKTKNGIKKYYEYQASMPKIFLKAINSNPKKYIDTKYYISKDPNNNFYKISLEDNKYENTATIKIGKRSEAPFTLPKKIITELKIYEQYITYAKKSHEKEIFAPIITFELQIFVNNNEILQYKLIFYINLIIESKFTNIVKEDNGYIAKWIHLVKPFDNEYLNKNNHKKILIKKL